MDDFKKGDMVKLKSGGPKMTIDDIGKYNYNDFDQAKCVWFEKDNVKQESVFSLETLVKLD